MPKNFDLRHFRLGHTSSNKITYFIKNVLMSHAQVICFVKHVPWQNKRDYLFQCIILIQLSLFNYYMLTSGGLFYPIPAGHHYFLTVVDDFTRFTLIPVMKNKSEAIKIIPTFYNMVFIQFNASIKYIRSDNGLEFNLLDFFAAKGIIHQLSCVGTPRQNEVVGRKHQHFLIVARALLFHSALPLNFWEDSVLVAAHIINRIPHQFDKTKPHMSFI